jgi:hypothetical protein
MGHSKRIRIESAPSNTLTDEEYNININRLLSGQCNSFLFIIIVIFHNQEKLVLNSIPTIINSRFLLKGKDIFHEAKKGYT